MRSSILIFEGAGSPVQTLILFGKALAQAGEHRRSVAIYKQAQQLLNRNHRRGSTIENEVLPVFIDLCRKVGQGWEKLGETRLAIESLQGINETDRDVSVQLMLGKLHRQLGQKMLAKECYTKAWKSNPFVSIQAKRASIANGAL